MTKGTLISIIIAGITLALAVPLTWIGNITTPLIQNWISRRSKASLDRRILKLESDLRGLEEIPEISDAEDEILWGIKNLRILIMAEIGFVLVCLYVGFTYLVSVQSDKLAVVRGFVVGVTGAIFVDIFRMRYERDFRWQRSPRYRKALRKSIDALKKIQATWGKPGT